MIGKLAILCIAFAIAQGAPSAPASYGAPPPPSPPPPPPPYAYNYAVLDAESGNDFSAEEKSKYGAISGQYKVLRADGVIMTVSYTVEGESGFVADVVTELPPPPPPAYGPPPAPLPTYV